jgi:hypothetical protein
MKVVSLSALRPGHLYQPWNIPGTQSTRRIMSTKNSNDTVGIFFGGGGFEPATFRLVAQFLNQLRHRVPAYITCDIRNMLQIINILLCNLFNTRIVFRPRTNIVHFFFWFCVFRLLWFHLSFYCVVFLFIWFYLNFVYYLRNFCILFQFLIYLINLGTLHMYNHQSISICIEKLNFVY